MRIKTRAQISEAAGAMGGTIDREDWHALRKMLNVEAAAKVQNASGTVK